MRVSMKGDDLVFDFVTETTRKCGGCTLCCKLLPVRELQKRGGERCRFQRHGKGCTVYHRADKGFPMSCGVWSCVWLNDPDEAGAMKRPDHSHYVVDPLPDFIMIQPDDTSEKIRINVVQVWLDPAYPEAHLDPALRSYLAMRGARDGFAALIRLNETDAWVLLPPALTGGEWQERGSRRRPDDADVVLQRSPDEIYQPREEGK